MVDRLRLDAETWQLYWLPASIEHFKNDAYMRRWNTKYAGRLAGNIVRPGPNVEYREVSMTVNGVRVRDYAHRIIWKMTKGPIPEGMRIDHRDCNGLNNDPANMRLATHRQNQCNRGAQRNSKTGIKGVCRKPNGRYYARINNKYLGTFNDEHQAQDAYRSAAAKVHGEFARP